MDGPKVFFDISIGGKEGIIIICLLLFSWTDKDAIVLCRDISYLSCVGCT